MWSYPWPIRDFQGPHQINATLGDYRQTGTNPRFHAGVDIQAFQGTNVYSIVSDTVWHYGATGVIVGGYTYIHLTARYPHGQFIEGIIDSTAPLDSIGITNQENHVDFNEGVYPNGPFQNSLRNGGLDNYTDSNDPTIIATPQFFPQGEELTTNRDPLHTDTLYEKVDIRVHMRDFANTGQGTGIYECSYVVEDTLHNPVHDPGITTVFDQVSPPPNGTPVVYVYDTTETEHANSATFHYWVTNPIVSNQVEDSYWNTKQQAGQPDSVDADSIEDALFKDGNYWVKVMAYDIRNNADSESLMVKIGNFRPEVRETEPDDGETGVSIHHPVYVRFSEAMDSMIDLRSAVTISPGVNGDWEWLNQKSILFTPDPAFLKNTTYTVALSSQLEDL